VTDSEQRVHLVEDERGPIVEEANHAFWRWQYRADIDDMDDVRAAFLAGWEAGRKAGGRAAIRASARLAALFPALREILELGRDWEELEEE
jgi:hypothetical protein